MAVEWSGSGPSLAIELSRGQPLGAQLQEALRAAVRTGRLAPGEVLPSSRRLAADLGTSRGLVQQTYEQLVAEGYLVSVPGGTTRAAALAGDVVDAAPEVVPPVRAAEIDFAPGRPDLSSLPVRDWTRSYLEAMPLVGPAETGYPHDGGAPALRQVLAAYARRVRAADTAASHVVVTTGFSQGLALSLAALRDRGVTRIAVEDPGHPHGPDLVARAGLTPVPVPVDAAGLDVDTLRRSDVRAVLTTPAHQTPTGVVLAPERRVALVAWARQHDGWILEDDYDSEFRYDRQPVGCIQGLAPDRVVLLGSVSKTLAPALRLGWLVAPPDLTSAVVAEKLAADRGSPVLEQLALARMIGSGRFDRHLRRMRRVYAARKAALTTALATHAPDLRLTGLDAGFHALLSLPEGADEAAVVRRAGGLGVGLQGLSRYALTPGPAGVVLGFGDLRESQISEGIARIAPLLRNT